MSDNFGASLGTLLGAAITVKVVDDLFFNDTRQRLRRKRKRRQYDDSVGLFGY